MYKYKIKGTNVIINVIIINKRSKITSFNIRNKKYNIKNKPLQYYDTIKKRKI